MKSQLFFLLNILIGGMLCAESPRWNQLAKEALKELDRCIDESLLTARGKLYLHVLADIGFCEAKVRMALGHLEKSVAAKIRAKEMKSLTEGDDQALWYKAQSKKHERDKILRGEISKSWHDFINELKQCGTDEGEQSFEFCWECM